MPTWSQTIKREFKITSLMIQASLMMTGFYSQPKFKNRVASKKIMKANTNPLLQKRLYNNSRTNPLKELICFLKEVEKHQLIGESSFKIISVNNNHKA